MRHEALRGWCRDTLKHEVSLEAMSGDAGARCYYRLSGTPWLAVDAPPQAVRNEAWLALQKRLAAGGVRVPEVRAYEAERGFWLIEDFGDRSLLRALAQPDADVEALYEQALRTLLAIQRCPSEDLPASAPALAHEERGLFEEWFIEGLLGMDLSAAERDMLGDLWETLVAEVEVEAPVLLHRDYHSRNLMLLADGAVGVLDFQDALRGPPTYDLASLLKDCYIRWPREVALRRLEYWRRLARDAGLGGAEDEEALLRNFERLGLQRHLRVLGTFARLGLRDKKSSYLNDIPVIMDYVAEACEADPALAAFADWLRARLTPQIAARLPTSAEASR